MKKKMDHARFSKVVKYFFNFQIGKIKANSCFMVCEFPVVVCLQSIVLPQDIKLLPVW